MSEPCRSCGACPTCGSRPYTPVSPYWPPPLISSIGGPFTSLAVTPDYTPAHEHAHTPLKIPRTNAGSLTGAGVIAGLVAVCTLFLQAFDTGHAGWVPGELQPYLPWIVFAATILLAFLGGVGVPSLHPGLPLGQRHYGRIERHDPGKEDTQVR